MTLYPCTRCDEECDEDTIQCSCCDRWTHSACIPMSGEQLMAWSDASLKFLCPECCFRDNTFDTEKALGRLKSMVGAAPKDVRLVTKTEKLLLETYGVQIPEATANPSGEVDQESVSILRRYHPVVLEESFPAKTRGDGNCFYRAISRALTGTESYHLLLRLFTLLEILSFPMYYDMDHKKFVDLVQDSRVVTATYLQLMLDVGTVGSYADMLHMYAMSAVLKLPIRSYLPPHVAMEYVSQPYSRKVCGRGVNSSAIPMCTIMWTMMKHSVGHFIPNHFVPLLKRDVEVREAEVIQLDTTMDHVDEDLFGTNSGFRSDNLEEADPEPVHHEPEEVTHHATEESDASPFIESDSVHPMSNGCLHGSFLETEEVVRQLRAFTMEEAHDEIPQGDKSDAYFVFKNADNIDNRQKGKRSAFSDDCGVWCTDKGGSPKAYYILQPDDKLKCVYKKDDKICYAKKVKGKKTFVPMDPQPNPDTVIELIRNYSTLKKDTKFKRRVSWLGVGSRVPIAIVEYLGKFPGLAPHGNSKSGEEYIRTPTTVMEEMGELLKRDNPLNVYNKLTKKHDVLSAPSSRRQVHDKNYNDKKKQRVEEFGTAISRGNIADHISEIDKMLADKEDTIVRSIVRDHGKAPCLILYTDEQLEDLKNVCCTGQSVLGIDKTFNLCDMHVTATCYKQTAVVMDSTGEPPIFLGPIFIHDNSDFESFSNFFNHLRIKLINTDTERLIFGTDEELALVNAMLTAFPEADHLLCIRHIRQNVKQKLVDDCADLKARTAFLDDIFGQDGILHAEDDICFDVKWEELENRAKEISAKFHRYCSTKLVHTLKNVWSGPTPPGHFDKSWTNNNSESLNHVLKRSIDWKSRPLFDLVCILKDIVDVQFKDLLRSLVSMGQYRVAATHKQFEVSKTAWLNKTPTERERLFKKFKCFLPPDRSTVTASDGGMTVIKPRTHGKKIGQRKRKVNERTTTHKKMRMDLD